jgi:hypothetical protein
VTLRATVLCIDKHRKPITILGNSHPGERKEQAVTVQEIKYLGYSQRRFPELEANKRIHQRPAKFPVTRYEQQIEI